MTALKAAEIDRFIARPDPARPVILVYGPDSGLVRERVDAIIAKAVDDPRDPFALARLEGEQLAANPARLVEEAGTVPLFGGKRAVWVKGASRNLLPAVEALLAGPAPDCAVVIETGELKKTDKLRAACEKSKIAAAIACYADDQKNIAQLIDDEMRGAGLTIAADAKAALVPLLGGDRSASRSELRKLALYAHGKARVELEDIIAVIADASALALDAVVDAAFAGRAAEMDLHYAKARAAGTSPGGIMAAAQRHVAQLHRAMLRIDGGDPAQMVATQLLPAGQFRRQAAVESALQIWSSVRLERTMLQIAEASFETRRHADLAGSIAQRALMAIAVNARRRD